MEAQELVLLACRIAKGPGMVAIGGQFLRTVLKDLYLKRNLKVNRYTQLLNVGPNSYGPYSLEADYLRTYDMFFPIPNTGGGGTTVGGITQFLNPVTMEKWDAEYKSPSVANYPYEFATDLSTPAQTWSGTPNDSTLTSAGQLFIYPQSSGTITVTHRYMVARPDIVMPEVSTETPWFADDDYLTTAVAARVMQVTGDDRYDSFENRAMEILRPYLIQEGDEQQAVQNIRLDPQRFHLSKALRPVKSYPF